MVHERMDPYYDLEYQTAPINHQKEARPMSAKRWYFIFENLHVFKKSLIFLNSSLISLQLCLEAFFILFS
jgi:hypothetical protein